MTDTPYFVIDDLTIGYHKVPVIRDISVKVQKGEIIALIGPNGAGKSTLLKTIARDLEPIRGKIFLEGRDMQTITYRELSKKLAVILTERIKVAREFGDLSENAEYDAAKNEQAELEERIFKLEDMIKKAKIIKEEEMSNDFVGVGSRVSVKDMDNGDEMDFTIVGSTEADPFAGKISNESLVGQHLIGQKTGTIVEIIVPDGTLHYKITNISR